MIDGQKQAYLDGAAAERARIIALLREQCVQGLHFLELIKASCRARNIKGWGIQDEQSVRAVLRALADEIEKLSREEK